jgi:hypothetical protein
LQKLPLEFIKRELPPGFSSSDGLAINNTLGMVHEIQWHFRLSLPKKQPKDIVDPSTKEFAKDGAIPKLHNLTDMVY